MGPVFRTYDPQRDRLVAVKAFRLDIVPEQVARLAESLRRLAASGSTHPSIVPTLDAGLEGTTAYLAMEYIAAETLDVALRHLAPAPLDRALPVLSQIADAIDAAWTTGHGHGALHPRDVFVTVETGDVRVTGFGVLPALEAIEIKTPVRRPNAAPERVGGENWDVRADVYSLGAIAHELLTGRRPSGPGEQDGALTAGTTPEQRVQIRRVLSTALAERPRDRFASARDVVDALSAVARGDIVVALPAVPGPESAMDEFGAEEGAEEAGGQEVEMPPATPSPAVGTSSFFVWVPPPSTQRSESGAEPTESGTPHSAPDTLHPAPVTDGPGPAQSILVPPPFAEGPSTSFPWSTVGAVAIAGVALGTVLGYQYARGLPPPVAPAIALRSADTDVPVAPEALTNTPGLPTGPAATSGKSDVPPTLRAASVSGRLNVRSSPSGALVVVDGKPRGQTPSTVTDLALGDHSIEVARPGYVPHAERITLSAREAVRSLSVRLDPGASDPAAAVSSIAPATGSVFVDSRPQAARVIIDGRFVGTTPLRVPELSAGAHNVRLQLAGHRSYSTTVGIKSGELIRLTAALEAR